MAIKLNYLHFIPNEIRKGTSWCGVERKKKEKWVDLPLRGVRKRKLL